MSGAGLEDLLVEMSGRGAVVLAYEQHTAGWLWRCTWLVGDHPGGKCTAVADDPLLATQRARCIPREASDAAPEGRA